MYISIPVVFEGTNNALGNVKLFEFKGFFPGNFLWDGGDNCVKFGTSLTFGSQALREMPQSLSPFPHL
jgi:hypothetical protein